MPIKNETERNANPLRIGIDVRMANYSGIGRYIRGTVLALQNCPVSWNYLLFGKKESQASFPTAYQFIQTSVPIYSLTEQGIIPLLASQCDCLHVPHYNAPLFWRKKLVVTIHDLIHLRFSNHLPLASARLYARTLLPLVARRADAIIAVSEYTKKDLITTLGLKPDKIVVIHHGIDLNFLTQDKQSRDGIQEPYFIYVGLIKAHKNLGVLLEAFSNLRRKLKDKRLRLCLIGRPDLKQEIVRNWMEKIKEDSGIIHKERVSEDELKPLYRNSVALVFPSLYEGFGFPLLEAMASRIPIIASMAASIPEVVGADAALYFDPRSPSELETCLERILASEELRSKLIQAAQKRLPLFDWETSARKTVRVYESVLGRN